MTKFTLTKIKAIAACDINEKDNVQDAILVHSNDDEFGDGDCIVFGADDYESWDDEDVEAILFNEDCPIYRTIREDGVYIAN